MERYVRGYEKQYKREGGENITVATTRGYKSIQHEER